ncbi:hypothetical protein [Polyangium aurulentum]|uniref:hypothetical protein n=1 Tax=Polyangium aurulentum TaxID=2567896 RepID=UPI0010AEBE98|nr:hypothetical protein [Polyangium aurulentum]UQA63381.1 hypothetical protein E8A73_024095 [Polyangium aurulentum]
MKKLHAIVFFGLALSAAACSGLDDDTQLKDLDSSQIEDLCSEVESETKDCNGIKLTRDASSCRSNSGSVPDSCTATVGDARSCNEADLCEFATNSGCAKLAQCSGTP